MAKTTRQRLGAALYSLLREHPLSEINVSDVTALCGLSRKTFYYYYQDVYSLVYGYVEDLIERIAVEEDYGFWQIFERLVRLVQNNSEVVLNVYNCVDRELLYNFLHRTLSKYSRRILLREIGGTPCSDEDLDVAGNMCVTGMLSLFLQWIHFHLISGMDEDFLRHKDKLQGFSRVLIEHMCKNSSGAGA